jgi:hypothetical protein
MILVSRTIRIISEAGGVGKKEDYPQMGYVSCYVKRAKGSPGKVEDLC